MYVCANNVCLFRHFVNRLCQISDIVGSDPRNGDPAVICAVDVVLALEQRDLILRQARVAEHTCRQTISGMANRQMHRIV